MPNYLIDFEHYFQQVADDVVVVGVVADVEVVVAVVAVVAVVGVAAGVGLDVA